MARVVVLVALVDEAEAAEGEQFVDLGDVLGTAGDETRESSGGDGLGIRAQLGDHAFEDAVDQADVAVVEADLEVVDGAGADDLGGLADVDAREAGRAGKQRFGGDPETGGDGSAEELAFGGDDVEGGGGAEVDDDDGRVRARRILEELVGRDGVDDPVGADVDGVVGEDGQTGADAWFDEERLEFEVELDGSAQSGVERRNDG